MSTNRQRLGRAFSHVRRCAPGPFCVVALTHVPFLLLLLSLASTLLEGRLALLFAPIGAVLFLLVCVFAALPMSVALSGYFIALAKGRHPRVMSIFCVFSDMPQYRHALNATLCPLLRITASLLVCAAPLLFYPMLCTQGAFALFIICLCAMVLMLFGRLLAYAFAGHFAWEYPYLTPREALRLSVHVTRGRRFSLLVRLLPLIALLMLTAPTLGLLSLAVLPFFYVLLADCYIDFKQCEGVTLPSPKEYADV